MASLNFCHSHIFISSHTHSTPDHAYFAGVLVIFAKIISGLQVPYFAFRLAMLSIPLQHIYLTLQNSSLLGVLLYLVFLNLIFLNLDICIFIRR